MFLVFSFFWRPSAEQAVQPLMQSINASTRHEQKTKTSQATQPEARLHRNSSGKDPRKPQGVRGRRTRKQERAKTTKKTQAEANPSNPSRSPTQPQQLGPKTQKTRRGGPLYSVLGWLSQNIL